MPKRAHNDDTTVLHALETHGTDLAALARVLGVEQNSVRARLNRLVRAGKLTQHVLPAPQTEVRLTDLTITLPEELVAALAVLATRLGTDASGAATHLLRAHFEARLRVQQTPRQLMVIQAEAKARGHVWTEQELLDRGLPLYWSEDWLRRQLANGLTFRALEAMYSYKTRTLSQYALRYGMQQRVETDERTYRALRDQVLSGRTRAEAAATVGFSEVTAARATRGVSSEKARYMQAKLEAGGPYPATTSDIARRLFGGEAKAAAPWLYRMVKSGRLLRLQYSIYTRPDTTT